MRALYTTTLVVGLVLLAPVFLVRGLRHKKYLGNLRERFGDVDPKTGDRPVLMVHAVSVGEVLAAEPLLKAVGDELQGWQVVLSTTTATGQALARNRFPELEVLYFPLDLPFAVRKTLDRVKPSAVCVVETEIWPNFLAECDRRGIPVALVNGRISDRSYQRYRRVGRLLRPVLDGFAFMTMQSESDLARILRLGAPADRASVAGNLKYDVDLESFEARMRDRRIAVDAALALPDDRPLIVAGSTVDGEEALVAQALKVIRRHPGLENARLLIAPRHPERFDQAVALIEAEGLVTTRRSDPRDPGRADVLVLDSIGELAALYAHADAVFVGGSLVARGGHNILEPALYRKPIVVGPHTENFRQIVEDFQSAGAVVQLDAAAVGSASVDPLAEALAAILSDQSRAVELGEKAGKVMDANRGATTTTLSKLREMLGLAVPERVIAR